MKTRNKASDADKRWIKHLVWKGEVTAKECKDHAYA